MGVRMNAYLLECLFPTGWRRTGQLYWRYCDAVLAADAMIFDNAARAVRILPVLVSEQAVFAVEASPSFESLEEEQNA